MQCWIVYFSSTFSALGDISVLHVHKDNFDLFSTYCQETERFQYWKDYWETCCQNKWASLCDSGFFSLSTFRIISTSFLLLTWLPFTLAVRYLMVDLIELDLTGDCSPSCTWTSESLTRFVKLSLINLNRTSLAFSVPS